MRKLARVLTPMVAIWRSAAAVRSAGRIWTAGAAAMVLALGIAASPAGAHSSPVWLGLAHPAKFNPGAMLLLHDGRVLVQDNGAKLGGTSRWWLLTPSASGSYRAGTWKRAASLAPGYGPMSFASGVLPDGRVLIEGGEYNFGKNDYTNKGAIYDPIKNSWTAVAPPMDGQGEWVRIGDAPSAVLADGDFMLGASGYTDTTVEAIFNATTLTWTATGTNKADGNGEEGWSLLPDGELLTVDTSDVPNTELYDPTTGSWHSAGTTRAPIVDLEGEIGPQVLMPDGAVFAAGANGDNALYETSSGKWTAAPPFPVIKGKQYDIADGPSAVLPDGDVLLEASPGEYTPPSHFFVYDGTRLNRITDAPDSAHVASDYGFMLELPTGQILYDPEYGTALDVYNAGGRPQQSWRPSITSVPTQLSAGTTYTLSGRQLNGLTQGSAYGDDFQDATNYPLVRITSDSGGVVTFARTFGFSNMSIAPGDQSSTEFTVPRSIRNGKSKLVVVTNGITSPAVAVTVRGGKS
jgi:hypothetical protein